MKKIKLKIFLKNNSSNSFENEKINESNINKKNTQQERNNKKNISKS